jgi:hypothetical protein
MKNHLAKSHVPKKTITNRVPEKVFTTSPMLKRGSFHADFSCGWPITHWGEELWVPVALGQVVCLMERGLSGMGENCGKLPLRFVEEDSACLHWDASVALYSWY